MEFYSIFLQTFGRFLNREYDTMEFQSFLLCISIVYPEFRKIRIKYYRTYTMYFHICSEPRIVLNWGHMLPFVFTIHVNACISV